MLPEIVYITQLDTGTRIALPLTPEKVSDKREGNFISYNILNAGEVKIPNGEKLAQFSWNGILPGVSMLGMGIVSLFDWKPPRVMIGILDGWKKNRKKLRLLVTGTAINHDVYIQNFTVTHEYFDRAEYSISFVQAKDILIKTTDESDGKTDGGSLDERPASAAAAASTQATRQNLHREAWGHAVVNFQEVPWQRFAVFGDLQLQQGRDREQSEFD